MRPAPVVVGVSLSTGRPVMSDPMVFHRGVLGGPTCECCCQRYGPVAGEPSTARILDQSRRLLEGVMVRGKFKVQGVKRVAWSPTAVEITLSPEYDTTIPEDQKYAKATPSGSITMMVDNPPAAEYLALGKTFYVDFTEAS